MLTHTTSGATRRRMADRIGAPSRAWRRGLPVALAALLVACGGGGGDGSGGTGTQVVSPPTAAATLANSSAEAAQSAQAAANGATAAATRASSLSGLSVLLGGSVGPLQLHLPATRQVALSAGRDVQAQSVQTEACAALLDLPCSGSATLDTNVADTATAVRPGDYADLRFSALSGSLLGERLTLNGRMRIEFLSAIDLNATQNPGLDLTLLLDSFSGSINGLSFGPMSDTSRLQIDTQGVATITGGGASYTGMSGMTVTGSGAFAIGGGRVRQGYWADSNRYIDLTLQNWHVVGSRPAVGSQAFVGAGDGSIAIRVTASSADSVVYAVTINVGSATSHYIVTASYPAGGGAPSYSAVAAS